MNGWLEFLFVMVFWTGMTIINIMLFYYVYGTRPLRRLVFWGVTWPLTIWYYLVGATVVRLGMWERSVWTGIAYDTGFFEHVEAVYARTRLSGFAAQKLYRAEAAGAR